VVRAQKLRTARPVNKNYRLLNILRNADVNKVGRPSSAVAELLLKFKKLIFPMFFIIKTMSKLSNENQYQKIV